VLRFKTFTLLIALLFGGLSSFGQIVKSKKAYLNICSFNVYKFGAVDPKYKAISKSLKDEKFARPDSTYGIPQRIENCAEILSKGAFELIVLQEVKYGPVGDSVISDLCFQLNEKYKRKYKWFNSEKIGKGLGMSECMAFLYDSTKVDLILQEEMNSTLLAPDEAKNRKYVKSCWKVRDFDFTLVSCHFAWNGKDPKRRQSDYLKLNDMLHHPEKYSKDPDLIIVGDFNRYGGSFSQNKKEFGIQLLDYDEDQFRVPHVDHFDSTLVSVKEVGKDASLIENQKHSTTVSDKNTFVYDQFYITKDVFEEYDVKSNEAGKDFGVFVYDETWGNAYVKGVKELSNNETKAQFSDHRPIWMRFKINTGNEDE
jgi:endonuclease/exonuclease/phosphatase family metal-dependent hydrolase